MTLTFIEFENLPSKARFINCSILFSAYLRDKGLEDSDWKVIIHVLNEINDFEFLDDWFYKYCEFMPDIILQEEDFIKNIEEWEHINLEMFQRLKVLYLNSTETNKINEIMSRIHEMGSIEMHSDSKNVAKLSFEAYSKFLDLVKE